MPLEAPVAGRAGLEHALLTGLGQQVIPEPALALDQLKECSFARWFGHTRLLSRDPSELASKKSPALPGRPPSARAELDFARRAVQWIEVQPRQDHGVGAKQHKLEDWRAI